MAKRVRGSRSAHRPGGQGPSHSKKTADSSTEAASEASDTGSTGSDVDTVVDASGGGGTDAAISESTATESQAVATTAAAATAKPRRARRRNKTKQDDLASREADEDVWVREDLRRIGIISVVLLIGLAVAWVVFYYVDVLNLY